MLTNQVQIKRATLQAEYIRQDLRYMQFKIAWSSEPELEFIIYS